MAHVSIHGIRFTRLLAAAIACAVMATAGFGEEATGTLKGTVTSSGAPLRSVTITVTSPKRTAPLTATSDTAGNYRFATLPEGVYAVTFELQGLRTVTKQVTVAAGAIAQLDVNLDVEPEGPQRFSEEVTVTGSLIPRPAVEAMSPVSTVEPEQIETAGTTRVEDLLTTLPQVYPAQNSTISNGASFTATVSLRNLGSVRTLVLLDGRRMSPGDVGDTAPDLNFIPTALVKRIDILTGGASSVYGADAVGGVVNFILDKDFEGLKTKVSGVEYEHNNDNAAAQTMNAAVGFAYPRGTIWDGQNVEASVALGGKFGEGKGHASAYAGYRKIDAMLKSARDYTNCSVASSMTMRGPACGGSANWQYGKFMVFDPDYTKLIGTYVLDSSGPGDTLRKRKSTDMYNYGPWNYMQRPDRKLTAGAFLNYDFNKHVQAYSELMFMDDYSVAQLAPSGDFNNTTLLNCDNPMLSADEVKKFCTDAGYGPHDMANVTIARRNVEGGPRQGQVRHDDVRLVAGLKGDIGRGWSYDAYGLDAQVQSPGQGTNDFNIQHLQDALIVDGDPNDPTTWHCHSHNPGCVPWNIFKIGGVTKAALDYLYLPSLNHVAIKTQMASAKVTGDLRTHGLTLPTASEGIKVAAGTEYRKESMSLTVDLATTEGLGASTGIGAFPSMSGSFKVKELFTEVLIPLIQNARGAKDLALELGYRRSRYNLNGTHATWKIQTAWMPTADVKFRGSANRATRAPNVMELFTPQYTAGGASADPCAGPTPSFTQEQCARTGVAPAQYGHVPENPAGGAANGIAGGNPKLDPEVADTRTFGVVFTPRALAGLSAAFDYYDIRMTDTIGTLVGDDILNQCAITGDPRLCRLIHRDIAGTLWLYKTAYIDTTNQNIGKLGSRGIDMNLTYLLSAERIGSFTFNVVGTRLLHTTTNTGFGIYSYDCVGYFGNRCGAPMPEWRHLARLTWETPRDAAVSLGWRMVGGVTVDSASSNPMLSSLDDIPLLKANNIYSIPARHYVDLAATYHLAKGLQFTLGVNNMFDKEPPLGAGMIANDYGTGFFGTYDPYGRMVHTSLKFAF